MDGGYWNTGELGGTVYAPIYEDGYEVMVSKSEPNATIEGILMFYDIPYDW